MGDFVPFRVSCIKQHSHDVKLIELKAMPHDGLTKISPAPIASCVLLARPDQDKAFRPYTPVMETDKTLVFAIKIYPDGMFSPWLATRKIWDEVMVKRPLPKLDYAANRWKELLMVCGGTGITPMYQVLRTIAENPDDRTRVCLISAQKSMVDVLLLEGLERCQKLKPDQFSLVFVFSDPSADDNSHFPHKKCHGHIDADLLKSHIPSCKEYKILVCGPERMMESICGSKNPDKSQGDISGHLKSLGQDQDHIYKF